MLTQHASPADDRQEHNNSAGADDDGVVVPGSPPPLGTGRTDVNPGDEAGVDELPRNDGAVPLNSDDDLVLQDELPDVDVDNAELDDAPNPR